MKRPLRFYALVFAGVFAMLIVLSAAAVLLQVVSHIENQTDVEVSRTLIDKIRVTSQLVRFYRGVAERIAQEPEPIELLLFGDPPRAEQWSASVRRRLPGVVGVALFSDEGTILGDAPSQRVGPECLADMRKLARGETLAGPPVHSGVPGLTHFDVVMPVINQDQRIGLMFLSVSVATVKNSLEEVTTTNESVTLLDASDRVLVGAGRPLSGKNILTQTAQVPETAWTLRYRLQPPPMRDVYISFASVTTVTILIIGVAMIALVSLAVRRLTHDLTTIQNKLQALASGGSTTASEPVHLRETEAMLPALDRIAETIQKRQQQLATLSETDELTGLPNRRAYESQYIHYAGLARRGTSVVIGLVDIDYFKPINDKFGHVVGDEVLRQLATALRTSLRASDLVARVGGDEFVVALVDIDTESLPDWFIRLRTLFQSAAPPAVPAETLSLSAGFTVLDTDQDTPMATAMKRADEALYAAKGAGRGQCQVHNVAGNSRNHS